MYLIKVLVEDFGDAEDVSAVLCSGEEHGDLDFPFSVRITEELSKAEAEDNLMRENRS